jgi:F-type H+-transporting ATPase subunit beta
LPAVDEAIAIAAWNLDRALIVEVQQHFDPTTVRAVALENAAGLKRGASAGPRA